MDEKNLQALVVIDPRKAVVIPIREDGANCFECDDGNTCDAGDGCHSTCDGSD